MKLSESEYEWAKLPDDLPHKNLVLITAKTPHPTFHKDSKEYPVRLFTSQELLEASRSLAHRQIGLNHLGLIEGAFTVDAQYNSSTGNTEALCYFPDEWIDKVRTLLREGKESIFSVEYTWRDERFTESGVEFIGLIFDKVDLLCGLNAGDKYTSAKLVESTIKLSFRRALCEADAEFIGMDKNQQDNYQPEKDEAFFKECECEYGKLDECNIKGYESMYVSERLGEPFAGYKDFSACVAANKDKGNPQAYCGYIKHKVEDKKGKESVEPLDRVSKEDQNPNTILLKDKEPTPLQRPEETNLLNNEPQQGISNQDPPQVDRPVMNVASAGFIEDNKGPVGVGGEPEKGRVEWTMSGSTVPKPSDSNSMVSQQETHSQGQSMGAETTEKNPIEEKIIGRTTLIEQDNPVVEGLNKTDGPSKAQSSMVIKEQECEEKLTESEIELKKKLEESIAKLTTVEVEKSTLVAQNTSLLAKVAELEPKAKRVEEIEPALNKLQENAKTFEATKKLEVDKARKEGKQEVIDKVKTVLPQTSMVSGNLQGCYRVLVNDVKKKLYEAENS